MRAQPLDLLGRDIAAGLDPQPGHFLRPLRAHAVEPADRQFGDEGRALSGPDHAESVGFVLIAGDLGEEFVVAHPSACGEPGLGADFLADQLGDARRAADAELVLGHVEIGFVEAQRFDQVGMVAEDRADLLADLAIDVEAALAEDQVGTQPLGGDRGHGAAHAEPARFVTGGSDHAAPAGSPHGNGFPAQLGIVALLDAGEKGIHVDMDDLAQAVGLAIGVIGIALAFAHARIDSPTGCKAEPCPPPDILCRCEANLLPAANVR